MTSAAKIAANRRNAQRSTGPRGAAGKVRTRYNAFQHGLNVAARYDPATAEEIEDLADYLSEDSIIPEEQDLAMRAAEAQFEVLRMQRAKADLVNGTAKHLERTDASLSKGERAALAFIRKSKTLAAFDRYERRAMSSRNRLLRELRALQAPVERVGPPRPKQQLAASPFVENVLKLDIHQVVKAATEIGAKLQSQHRSSTVRIDWGWPPEKPDARSCVAVDLGGDHGLLTIFDVNRRQVAQSYSLARVRTRVGGGKWLVRCPESGKMVQELYWDAYQQRFRSRHALKLRYRSTTLPAWERHWERCQKLMDRIGATDFRDLPPRPKYMHRATYEWVCEEIQTEIESMYRAFFGESRFKEIETESWSLASQLVA